MLKRNNDSVVVKLIKLLPLNWQLAFISVGFLQRFEIYKTNLPGMMLMLNKNKEQSIYLKGFLQQYHIENTESVFITMDGSIRLHALFMPPKNGKFACLFHGIKGNWIDNPPDKNASRDYNPQYRMLVLEEFAKSGFGFLAFSLPGFNPSEGMPGEEDFHKACDAFASFAIRKIESFNIKNNSVVVWGESLGTAAATIFANKLTNKSFAPAVLSLVAPFDSLINMVRNKFPYFSEKLLLEKLSEKLDTLAMFSKLDKRQTSIHIVSAQDDNIIPLNNTLNLVYEARKLGFNVLYHPTEGSHTTWDTKEVVKGNKLAHIAREHGIELAEECSVHDIEKILLAQSNL